MKKYLIVVAVMVALFFAYDWAYFHLGWYLPKDEAGVVAVAVADEVEIYLKGEEGYTPFLVRGVNLGSAIPGEWGADYAIDEETYLRWFAQMQEMGANTIRVYTVQGEKFYRALLHYNQTHQEPMYLLQGIWVNDYIQFSHRDAFDDEFLDAFLENCRTAVDVIHGRKKISFGRGAAAASGSYRSDVSDWVIGYIPGVEWEASTVAYTNETYSKEALSYRGKYMYTEEGAKPFEVMLAQVGDKILEYESQKYQEQRLIAFSNRQPTDPFLYPEVVGELYNKYADIDVEYIRTTEHCKSGQFASYQVYPFQTDFLFHTNQVTDREGIVYHTKEELKDYPNYLTLLNQYHSMPVVITEFGISAGRNIELDREDTEGIYSKISEQEQSEALKDCWLDIMGADCAGGCIYSWQDDWSRRTWNTRHAINEERTTYWSDWQTNGQYFGLLAFEPGAGESVCYIDGETKEWDDDDILLTQEGMTLSFQYDEKYIYLRIHKPNFNIDDDTLYIPIDVTPKTGSNYCIGYDVRFGQEADFLLVLQGKENSRLLVQERYDALRSTWSSQVNGYDTYRRENIPDKKSPEFVPICTVTEQRSVDENGMGILRFGKEETGNLRYGNANPNHIEFDSLADFCSAGDEIETRIPWQLLNFSDPSTMEIHDDYFDDNYGIVDINIKGIYLGIGSGSERIAMEYQKLKGWENNPTYHERLKRAYFVMQDLWRGCVTE